MTQESQSPPDSPRKKWVHQVGAHLRKLANDPGALARLRRGLGKEPGTVVGSARREVQHMLPSTANRPLENALMTVATLFASYPDFGHRDFGAALRAVDPKGDNGSVERRFVAVLNAASEDLPVHLRHAVSLLRAKGIALDWEQLLADLLNLSSEQDWAVQAVRRRWARSFWSQGGNHAPDEATAPAESAPQTTQTN